MPNYVEEDYSNDYVEGDNPSSTPTECDLIAVTAELAIIKQQNVEIKLQNVDLMTKLDTILAKVNSNNTINLSTVDKVTNIESKVNAIPTSQVDISNLATQDFILNKIPFVDDTSLVVYPKGSEVLTAISSGVFIVESSKYVPTDAHTFTVVYTLSKEIDGEKRFSEFHASYVVLKEADRYMLISDCPNYQG